MSADGISELTKRHERYKFGSLLVVIRIIDVDILSNRCARSDLPTKQRSRSGLFWLEGRVTLPGNVASMVVVTPIDIRKAYSNFEVVCEWSFNPC